MNISKELHDFIQTPHWAKKASKNKAYAPLIKELKDVTDFLPEDALNAQRGWHVKNNVKEVVYCKTCKVTPVRYNNATHQYSTFCSAKCTANDADEQKKRQQTLLKKYGVTNPSQSEEIKKKVKETNQDRYGVDYVLQDSTVREQIKQTNLKKYGVENPMQNDCIRDKAMKTTLERYGVEYYSQTDEYTERIKEQNLETYGVEHLFQSEEFKEDVRSKMLEEYSVEHYFQSDEFRKKYHNSIMERYGVDNVAKSDEIKERIKQANLERYGVEWSLQSEEVRQKIHHTNIERYGGISPFSSEEVKDKVKQTNLEKYDRESVSQIHIDATSLENLKQYDWIRCQHLLEEKSLREISVELGVSDVTVGNYLKLHGIPVQYWDRSMAEKNVSLFVKSICTNVIESNRNTIYPYELDIYIPDHNVAIEYDGLYWHSEHQKSKEYHKIKTDLCREKGIRLIHIFEDEWLEKEELIKEKILNILGKSTKEKIYARKTKVVEVDTKAKSIFFDKNHIQGNGPSSINYGLEHDGELVAVLGFIKQKDHFALNRYATSKNVVGGFTKLLTHFEREYNSPKILTFADLRWSEGDLYYNTGFVLDKEIPPDYFWCKGNQRWHKFNWRHTGMKQKLEKYDPNLSETQNMHNHGFYRIWDCGKLRFVKN